MCHVVTTYTNKIDFSTFPDSDGEPVAEAESSRLRGEGAG